MKILVTGGAGFGGSNFIRYILDKYPDYKIVNLDKLTYAGNLNNLKDLENNPRYEFVKGDIADKDIVNNLIKETDFVINYAAETHVDRSIDNAEAFINTNINGVYILLEAMKSSSVKKFIQISTDEVFGSIDEGKFKDEDSFAPNSPYSAAKAAGDLLCRAYFKTYNLPIVITHSCNFYGPYQYPEKLIPFFITNLLDNKKVPIYGDGKNIREWIYTLDHARAIDLLLHKGVIGEVYNIGTGDEKDNLQITSDILKKMGFDKSMIEFVKDRAGHDKRYAVDSTKLRSLGWQPEMDFDRGLEKTINWYKENTTWWRRLKNEK